MNASQKIAQYLDEAKASEDALIRVLQSQIAMTPDGSYRSGLEEHLGETREHSRRLKARIRELGQAHDLIGRFVGLTEGMVGQGLALAKTPLDLMRGSGGEEKVLKNAKDAAATEALEIATYTAIEQLARSLEDSATAELAQSIRAEEERMLARIIHEIPSLTDAVVRAELKDDPSYELGRTGAADAIRHAGSELQGVGEDVSGAVRQAARQGRRVPGVAQAEGQVKGALADERDLAIHGYGDLTAAEINARLPALSQIDLAKIESFERAHQDRKTVLERIDSLRATEPWPGYDELTVSEVTDALEARTDNQVNDAGHYERTHKNRAGVSDAVDRRLAAGQRSHGHADSAS